MKNKYELKLNELEKRLEKLEETIKNLNKSNIIGPPDLPNPLDDLDELDMDYAVFSR